MNPKKGKFGLRDRAVSFWLLLVAGLSLFPGCQTTGTHPIDTTPLMQEVPPKVGLALGGGGARGFAEVGVLRVLVEEKIPIDFIAGTSVGSLIGALYADDPNIARLELQADQITAKDIFDRSLLSLLDGGLIKGEKLEQFLNSRLTHREIENLKIPFAAVATDLQTGETVPLTSGAISRAVHASASIPGVFVPTYIDGRAFVDGGITAPVPAGIARKMGADVVIAVSIPKVIPPVAPHNPLGIALQSVSIMSSEIDRCRSQEADVIITPKVGAVAFDDFSAKERLYEAGVTAARAAMPAIRKAMAEKTRKIPAGS